MNNTLRHLFSILIIAGCSGPEKPLEAALSQGSSSFQKVLKNPRHEVQIIYGQIRKDTILHYYHGVNDEKYYYPASTVKMPVAFASLERLSELGLSIDTQIRIDSQKYHPHIKAYDSLFDAPITVKQLLKKIFIYSDNEAYNILYRWLGKDYINRVHHDKGMPTRIKHLLSEKAFSFSEKASAHSLTVQLTDMDTLITERGGPQKAVFSLPVFGQQKGKAYINKTGKKIDKPFDFSEKNFVPLQTLLMALEKAVKPELFKANQRYDWSHSVQPRLMEIMNLTPQALPKPLDTLSGNHVKFLVFGGESSDILQDIEILNKVGWAYGYLTDVAYIRDPKTQVEFFLAATIHVNENEIYNDGIYEYKTVGLPFLGELGRLIYQYEKRERNQGNL